MLSAPLIARIVVDRDEPVTVTLSAKGEVGFQGDDWLSRVRFRPSDREVVLGDLADAGWLPRD